MTLWNRDVGLALDAAVAVGSEERRNSSRKSDRERERTVVGSRAVICG